MIAIEWFKVQTISFYVSLFVVLVALGVVLFLVVNKKWDTLRKIAYNLMEQAEKQFRGSKRGQEKFQFVFDRFYSQLPWWVRMVLTKEMIQGKLEEWFSLIKNSLNNMDE
jgi:hypothetical protein